MRRTLLLTAISLTLLVLSGCQQGAEPTNKAELSASPTPETVNTAAIEAELLRIENDWPRVIKERDAAAVERVEADDAVFVYPDGSTGGKAQDVKDIGAGNLTADSIEVADLKVNVLDANSAVVNGRTIVKNGKYKTPDGKTMDISGQYRFIDTFQRRNGEWKLVAGASTKIAQPAAAASPAATASPAAAASPAARVSPRVSPARAASPAASPATTP